MQSIDEIELSLNSSSFFKKTKKITTLTLIKNILSLYGDSINLMDCLATGKAPLLMNSSVAIYNAGDKAYEFVDLIEKFITEMEGFDRASFNRFLTKQLKEQMALIFGKLVLLEPIPALSESAEEFLLNLRHYQNNESLNPFFNFSIRIMKEKEFSQVRTVPKNELYFCPLVKAYSAKFQFDELCYTIGFQDKNDKPLIDELVSALEIEHILLTFALAQRERLTTAIIKRDRIFNLVKHIDCGSLQTNLNTLLSNGEAIRIPLRHNYLTISDLSLALERTEASYVAYLLVEGFAGHIFTLMPVNDTTTSSYVILQSNVANELERKHAFNAIDWVESDNSQRVYSLDCLVGLFNEFYSDETAKERKIEIYEQLFSLYSLTADESQRILSKCNEFPLKIAVGYYRPDKVFNLVLSRLCQFQELFAENIEKSGRTVSMV